MWWTHGGVLGHLLRYVWVFFAKGCMRTVGHTRGGWDSGIVVNGASYSRGAVRSENSARVFAFAPGGRVVHFTAL